MSDQELAVQAISEAQQFLEEYLEPMHHDPERLLGRLVEVLERPSVLVAVDRLRHAAVSGLVSVVRRLLVDLDSTVGICPGG
jgi:hypothetical protein